MRTPDDYRFELGIIEENLDETDITPRNRETIINMVKELYLESLRFECLWEVLRKLIPNLENENYGEKLETMIDQHYPEEWWRREE